MSNSISLYFLLSSFLFATASNVKLQAGTVKAQKPLPTRTPQIIFNDFSGLWDEANDNKAKKN